MGWWVVGLCASMLAGGCEEPPPISKAPPATVNYCLPVPQTVQEFSEFLGRCEPVAKVDVRARVAGYIQKIGFEDGQEVKKEQMLFQIDPRPFEAERDRWAAEVPKAEARLATAKRQLDRFAALAPTGGASQLELDNAIDEHAQSVAAVASAKASLEGANVNLSYTAIKSPLDGKISKAEFSEGNLISSDALLTTIVSIDPIYAYFDVDERTMLHFQEEVRKRGLTQEQVKDLKTPVTLTLTNGKQAPQEGIVDYADNQVNPQSGTIKVRAVFDNANRVLTPGIFVRASLPLDKPRDVLMVPDRAIGRDQDRKYLLIVGNNDVVEYRSVETGGLYATLRTITKGLSPAERVIVDGLQRSRPGATVQPREVSPFPHVPSTAPIPSTAPATQSATTQQATTTTAPAE